ncbi:MAG TPA: ureidoglycolate lyase [Devosia sp.]|nr:ureidoglycolate lyase [Devosia sp.]
MKTITVEPLTATEFAPYGNVIEISKDAQSFAINAGTTQRFHDLAHVTVSGKNARPIISMARAQPFHFPIKLTMLERHPDGSQAFIPVTPTRFLVVVAKDKNGTPFNPRAFLAGPGQGINYFQNTWHGVLSALDVVTDFIIVDRAGDGENLQIHEISEPYEIVL